MGKYKIFYVAAILQPQYLPKVSKFQWYQNEGSWTYEIEIDEDLVKDNDVAAGYVAAKKQLKVRSFYFALCSRS